MPIVAGGSGQYIRALLEGWDVPEVAPDTEFRQAKEQEAAEKGPLALHEELRGIDPERATELDPQNVRRVIRAREIYRVSGRRPSEYRKGTGPLQDFLVIGLTLDREALYRRIDERVDRMVESGLVEEVQRLADLGYPVGHGPLGSPGYREIGQ